MDYENRVNIKYTLKVDIGFYCIYINFKEKEVQKFVMDIDDNNDYMLSFRTIKISDDYIGINKMLKTIVIHNNNKSVIAQYQTELLNLINNIKLCNQ